MFGRAWKKHTRQWLVVCPDKGDEEVEEEEEVESISTYRMHGICGHSPRGIEKPTSSATPSRSSWHWRHRCRNHSPRGLRTESAGGPEAPEAAESAKTTIDDNSICSRAVLYYLPGRQETAGRRDQAEARRWMMGIVAIAIAMAAGSGVCAPTPSRKVVQGTGNETKGTEHSNNKGRFRQYSNSTGIYRMYRSLEGDRH